MTVKNRKRVHAFVIGRVQGVFYRSSAKSEAMRIGLTGWVKNLPDGRVELVAEGPPDAVDELLQWCYKGPAYSRVDRIEIQEETPTKEFNDFSVRY